MGVKETPSGFKEFSLSSEKLIALADTNKIPLLVLYDTDYFYVSLEDWGTLLGACLKEMPLYLAERRDCENLASILQGRVSERYALNSLGVATLVDVDHSLNLFPAEQTGLIYLYAVDPQNGNIRPISNFKVKRWEMR